MRPVLLLPFLLLALGVGCTNGPTSAPAASAQPAPVATHLGAWYWIGSITPTEAVVAASPERYLVDFAEAGRMQVRADCNRGSGSYTLEAGALAFGPIGLTKMGCAVDSQDREFLSQLASARSLRLDGDRLYVELDEGRGSMQFARDPKSVLVQ
jgi:heat shock protein HslJ